MVRVAVVVARRALWWMAAVLAVPGAAQALDVVRSGRSLAAVPTQLVPAPGAPYTALHRQDTSGSLAARSPETTLKRTAGPTTVLREAEVPPQRLEQTRVLLAELKARSTPDQAISIDLPADVLFDFDKAELRADASGPLEKASELIKSYPAAPLTVVGHTDGKGSDAYNNSLSLRRADAVAQVLLRQTGREAHAEGRGKREPVVPNTAPDGRDDPHARQQNRRVQILIGVPTPGKK